MKRGIICVVRRLIRLSDFDSIESSNFNNARPNRGVIMNIEGRVDLLKYKIISDDFLKGRGLGNEIPFWIFDYPPEDELFIRDSLSRIKGQLSKNTIGFIDIDLYELCLDIINKKISFERIIEFEEKKGSDELLKKIKIMLKSETIKKIIKEKIDDTGNVQVVFLTGIGKAWPLIRSHSILNNLQPIMGKVPLIAFYPGEYDNYALSLFGKFKDANYYRAFRLINKIDV